MICLRQPSVLAGLEANVTSVLSESKKLATCEVTELYSEQSASLKLQLSDLEFSALAALFFALWYPKPEAKRESHCL